MNNTTKDIHIDTKGNDTIKEFFYKNKIGHTSVIIKGNYIQIIDNNEKSYEFLKIVDGDKITHKLHYKLEDTLLYAREIFINNDSIKVELGYYCLDCPIRGIQTHNYKHKIGEWVTVVNNDTIEVVNYK